MGGLPRKDHRGVLVAIIVVHHLTLVLLHKVIHLGLLVVPSPWAGHATHLVAPAPTPAHHG